MSPTNPQAGLEPPAAAAAPAVRSARTYLASMRTYPVAARKAAIACVIAMALSPAGTVTIITYATGPIALDFGWTVSQTLTLFSLALIVAPIALPFAGRLVDRRGARAVAIPATLLYALTTIAVAAAGASKLQLGLLLMISTVFGYIGILAVVYKVVSAWFPFHRGLGFSVLIGASSSLGGAILAPIFESSIGAWGWRTTYVVLGLVILAIVVPAMVFLLSEPAEVRQERKARSAPDAQAAGTPSPAQLPEKLPGVSLSAAVRTRAFLVGVVILALGAGFAMSVRQNAVDLFGERGYDSDIVSLSVSALLMASIVGQIITGAVLDRAKSPRASAPFIACVLLGLLIVLSLDGAVWSLFAAMIVLGVASGAESTIGPYLVARYFGLRDFAQIQGLMLGITCLAIGVLPVIVQAMAEQSGSYSTALVALSVGGAAMLALTFFLPRYTYAQPVPEVKV